MENVRIHSSFDKQKDWNNIVGTGSGLLFIE